MDGERKGPKYRLIGLAVGSFLFAGSILLKDYNQYVPHTAIATASLASAGAIIDYALSKRHNSLKKEKVSKEARKPQIYQHSPSLPESPETAVARANPRVGRRVLEEISRNVMYRGVASEARTIAEQYLNQVKVANPDKIARSKGVQINFESKENTGLKRLLFGRGEQGYQINISLKDNDR